MLRFLLLTKDYLSIEIDSQLLASAESVILDLLLRETLKVAAHLLVGVGNPDRLLGVVGLLLLLLPDVVLHLQPGGRVRIGSASLLDMARHCKGCVERLLFAKINTET